MRGKKNQKRYGRTDSGNAELFADIYRDKVLFDHKQQRWLIWEAKGCRWTADKTDQVRQFAKTAAEARYKMTLSFPSGTDHDREEQKREVKWAIDSQNFHRIDDALKLAKAVPSIADTGDGWDADPWLFGVANGVVDLRTGNLRTATQQDRSTKCSPVVFDADAKCPRFHKFLAEIFDGDSELMAYVQKAVGYTVTGLTREQCFFACHGAGQNGKSTLFEVILHIMGDYGTDLPFSVLEKKKQLPVGEGMNLPGARFAKSVETREDLQLDEARIKSWTGGDTITINPKYRPPLSFTSTHKLWLAFNHKPRVSDDSDAMWRRVRLIPFKQTFDSSQVDKALLDKLKAEAPGILNWAIQGCLAWQKDGLKTPAVVERATTEYEEESDPLAPFFDDCCELGTTYQVPKANSFEPDWDRWASLAATKGWLVFQPNYRGSVGYGDSFMLSLIPRAGSRAGDDVLQGIDALVRDGIADPERLTIGGYSFGGYLTNWLITQTKRFKAAVTGAGDVEFVAGWGNNDDPFIFAYSLGGVPWEAESNYNAQAPIWRIANVTTPTHIVTGSEDYSVFFAEAYLLERALTTRGIPNRLLVFPHEGHDLENNPWHGKIKVREELRWLEKYGNLPSSGRTGSE